MNAINKTNAAIGETKYTSPMTVATTPATIVQTTISPAHCMKLSIKSLLLALFQGYKDYTIFIVFVQGRLVPRKALTY